MNSADGSGSATRSLVHLYLNVTAWYLALVAALWVLGVESIYAHPTPFYALPIPSYSILAAPAAAGVLWLIGIYVWASRGRMRRDTRLWLSLALGLVVGAAGFSFLSAAAETGAGAALNAFWEDLRWHLLAGGVFAAGFVLIAWAWPRLSEEPDRRQTMWLLLGLVTFAAAFAFAVAMVRGGLDGVTQTYERYTYEYIGDIGKTRTIPQLFTRYNELHQMLTMHSKVHPPGPIVILWLMSYVFTQEPLGLSIATVLFGSLTLIPLYWLTRDLAGGRPALVTAALFAVVPGFTLFNAVSADVTFLPFTVGTLWLFWRAIDRGSAGYAVAAGIGYACMSLISFSLIGIGAFFGFVGLWKLFDPDRRWNVFKTAAIMVVALAAIHGALWYTTGYDIVENFHNAKAQFDEDQHQLDQISPRYPAWTFRIWNPLCWFFYAGIPVSVLFIRTLLNRGSSGLAPGVVWVVLLTLLVLNLLYLGRGEGERSAMYLYPFITIPAGAYLARVCLERRSYAPFLATLIFVAMQTWAVETFLYTYW